MANIIYEVDDGSGNIYEVEAPEGTSDNQLIATLDAYLFEQEQLAIEPYTETPIAPVRQEDDLFTTNIGRGVDQLQRGWGEAIEGIGKVTGIEALQNYGTEVVEQQDRDLAETAGAARTTEDIEGVGSFLTEYAPATLGAQGAQLGSTLAGAAAGAKIGAAIGTSIPIPIVGTVAGSTIGGILGAIGANLPFFYGSNRAAQKEEIEKGNRIEVSEGAAALTALPQSALDAIADIFLVGKGIFGTAKLAFGGGFLTKAVKRGAVGAGRGIITEVPTEIGQQVLERYQAGKDLFNEEAKDEYFEVAVAAGLVGGTVRGTTDIVRGGPDAPPSTVPVPEIGGPASEQGDLFPSAPVPEVTTAPLRDQLRAEEETAAFEAERMEPKAFSKGYLESEVAALRDSPRYRNILDPKEKDEKIRFDLILERGGLTKEGEFVIPVEEAATRARLDTEEVFARTSDDPRQGDLEEAALERMIAEDERQAELAGMPTDPRSRQDVRREIAEERQAKDQEAARQRRINRINQQGKADTEIGQQVITTQQEEAIVEQAEQVVPTIFTEDGAATIPEGTPEGTPLTVYDAEGNPVEVELVARSAAGTVKAKTKEGKEIIVGGELTFENATDPNYVVGSRQNKPISDFSNSELEAFLQSRRQRLKDVVAQGATKQGVFESTKREIIAARAEKARRTKKQMTEQGLRSARQRRAQDDRQSRVPQQDDAGQTDAEGGRGGFPDSMGARGAVDDAPEADSIELKESAPPRVGTPKSYDVGTAGTKRRKPPPVIKGISTRFRTAKGSVYDVDNDTGFTTRTKKSPGKGQGTTYEPHNVLYVPSQETKTIRENMQTLTPTSTRLGYRRKDTNSFVNLANQSTRNIPDDATPMVIVVDKNNKVISSHPASLEPERGLSPVEKLYNEKEGTSNTHIGNEITEVYSVMPTAASVESEVDTSKKRGFTPKKKETPLETLKRGAEAEVIADKLKKKRAARPLKPQLTKEEVVYRSTRRKNWQENTPVEAQEFVNKSAKDYTNALPSQLKKDPDPTTQEDRKAVSALLAETKFNRRKGKPVYPENATDAEAAAIFFSKRPDDGGALQEIIHAHQFQLTGKYEATKNTPAIEAEYFRGLGKTNGEKALRWVRANLSKRTNEWVDTVVKTNNEPIADGIIESKIKPIDYRRTESSTQTKARKSLVTIVMQNGFESDRISKSDWDAMSPQEKVRWEKEQIGILEEKGRRAIIDPKTKKEVDPKTIKPKLPHQPSDPMVNIYLGNQWIRNYLAADAVIGLDIPVHPLVRSALSGGDLRTALGRLAVTSPSKRISQIAQTLERRLGDTKIEIVRNLKNNEGVSVAGLFDPKTNTIKVDAEIGVNPHTLLHETTHALTSATIQDNKTIRNQLETLFNKVEGLIDTAYGLQRNENGSPNLDEFVAEAFSNPKFQKQLSRIHPDGSPISALERFFNTITNFVRRMLGMKTKPLGSVLDETDQIIRGMLAPAPQFRNANELNLIGTTKEGVKKILGWVGETQKSFTSMDAKERRAFLDKIVNFFETAGDTAKNTLKAFMNARVLADSAVVVGFGDIGHRLQHAIEQMHGAAIIADQEVKQVLKGISSWVKKNPELEIVLNRVIYSPDFGATIYQLNPTLTAKQAREKYTDKEGKPIIDESGNVKLEIWKELKAEYNKLDQRGKEAYVEIRELYAGQNKKLREVLKTNIDDITKADPNDSEEVVIEKRKARSALNDLYKKLLDSANLEEYFPLVRTGDFSLAYTNKKEAENARGGFVFRMFESKQERDRVKKELEAEPDTYDNIKAYNNPKDAAAGFKKRDAPSASFVAETLRLLERAGVKGEVQSEFMSMYLATLPETSLARSLQKREGVMGYEEDFLLALRTKAFDNARQISNIEFGGKIKLLEQEIDKLPDRIYTEEETQKALANGKITKEQAAIYDQVRRRWGRENKSRIGKITEEVLKDRSNGEPLSAIKTEMEKRAQFARLGATYKNIEPVFKNMNQFAFIYTIGGSVSSSFVNLTNVPMFALPYMAAEHGMGAASKAVAKGYKYTTQAKNNLLNLYDVVVDAEGNEQYTVKKDLELPSVEGRGLVQATAEQRQELEEMIPMIKLARERGWLSEGYVAEAAGIAETGRQARGNTASRILDRISRVSAIMFVAGERYTRQTVMTAEYSLILNQMKGATKFRSLTLGKTVNTKDMSVSERQELAAREALYHAEAVNGGIMLETAPRVAQQHVGRVALMYKNFGINLYSTMLRSAKTALDSEHGRFRDSEVRKIAAKQLVAAHLAALLFAGVQGVPIYGAVALMANLLFYDDEEEDFDTDVRKLVSEGWYKGYLAELSGIDISHRIKLTDLLWEENRYNPDPSPQEFFVDKLGGASVSSGLRVWRGLNDIWSGGSSTDIERGFEQLVPPSISNAYKSIFGRYQREGGMYTRLGNPIYDDITGGELFFQALGFAPTGYTFEQERNHQLKKVDKAVNKRRSTLLKRYYLAVNTADGDEVSDVIDEIRKFNERHPRAGITGRTVLKSIKARMRTRKRTHNGITMSPLMYRTLMQSRAEYDD